MKIILTERQYKIILEQPDSRFGAERFMSYSDEMNQLSGNYKDISANAWSDANKAQSEFIHGEGGKFQLQVLLSELPFIGPYIGALFATGAAVDNYKAGNYKTAGLLSIFGALPFIGPITKVIPGISNLGSKGMMGLASKLTKGQSLTKAETEIANAVTKYTPEIRSELSKMAPKLKSIINDVQSSKALYVQKYGEQAYNDLLAKYLYGGLDKESFVGTLKGVKSPSIRVKPVLGGGADHRVFQSSVNPNIVFKAEVRPGEINKWFDTFKKYPKVFAKTLRKTRVKGTNGELLDAVAMEKLDTQKFMTLWDTMSSKLGEFQKKLGPTEQTSLENLVKSVNKNNINKTKWEKFIPYFKQQYPNLSKQAEEFSKMVDELYKITPNPDIRKFNLGYDASGVLKALDI
jgi:hypothetical protein